MKSKKLVSIIIPAFNEEENILECINSLFQQSYKDKEIIIVDDGSTDQTLLMLDELQKKYPELKILKQIHQGPAKARNLASVEAKGEILVFMDADMTFDKDFVMELISPILEGRYRGTFSKEEYISNWGNVWARCWNFNQNLPPKRMIRKDYPDEGLDFRAILKTEFLKVKGFDDTGYTDTWSLAKKLGYRPHTVVGAKYYHSNPGNLAEVFYQAKWVSKREYKYGLLGKIAALIRVSLPISLIIGISKTFKYNEINFLLFKIIYDLAGFIGILEMIFRKKLAK